MQEEVMTKLSKDGSHHFCVDYRELNTVTKQDTCPLPCVDELLDQLSKTLYFSSLDLASSLLLANQSPFESQPKIAFITDQGLLQI